MESMSINWLAVIVATLSDLAVGALWFSPALFYKPWMKANGFTEEDLKGANPAKVFGITTVLAFIISVNLAFFLADPGTTTVWGITAGFLAGIWAAAAFAIVALFERRNAAYVFINTGYMLVAFTLKGFILGIWR